jgi:hypothetical protein
MSGRRFDAPLLERLEPSAPGPLYEQDDREFLPEDSELEGKSAAVREAVLEWKRERVARDRARAARESMAARRRAR